MVDFATRFWSKVDTSAGPDGCWPWTGYRNPLGYGTFRLPDRTARAHRVAFYLAAGHVPDGLCVCHQCDNPPCCNPAHLFLGTNADNVADRHAKGRSAHGERSGFRMHPEAYPRGAQSWAALHPEQMARPGMRNPRARLTLDMVTAIAADLAKGMSERGAAQKHGLSRAHVRNIKHGRHWTQRASAGASPPPRD